MSAQELSIIKFYEDQSIFITGATGGIGKMLLEKLLRTCPKIKEIYLLVREKKGKSSSERWAELFNTPVIILFNFLILIIEKKTILL